jgi:hypothetical protein
MSRRPSFYVLAVLVASIRSFSGLRRLSSKGRLSRCFQARIQHRQKRERDHQPGWQIRANRTILAKELLALSGLVREGAIWGNGRSQIFQ